MDIPEIPIHLVPESEEAREAVGYTHNPDAGKRSKFGGKPEFIQGEDWPECCGKKMTFYAQLDSIGEEFDLADCGIIYVFVCYDCFETRSQLQCF